MATVVDVGVAELAATRFAISPLGETVSGLQLLGLGVRPPGVQDWVSWARRELRRSRLSMPTAWPLLHTERASFPEFLTPAPARPEPTVAEELAQVRRTRSEQVRTSLRRVFGKALPPEVARVARTPSAALREITAELATAHDLLVAPHWPRLRAVLLADIVARARQLALGGAAALLEDLGPDVRWDAGRLVLDRPGPDRVVTLGKRGLVLVPTILFDSAVRIKGRTSTQITLRYPARGAATVWSAARSGPADSTVRLLGRPRAELLELLRAPHTTGGLAAHLGVTAGAVSQHLGVLRSSGLVRTERSGRTALHVATDLAIDLLERQSSANASRAST